MASTEQYDVIILGGGLAGLTLARQLKRAVAETKILIAEKQKHPVPEAAFKVGEATAEVGSHYFSEVLGMKKHLKEDQLPKLGLRFFFSAGDNSDITRRAEVGPTYLPRVPTYQIDRGRFENKLAGENQDLGVDFRDACTVRQVALGKERHTVTLVRGETEHRVSARWVVDASGRASLLKRHLDLFSGVNHGVNAIWFRIGESISCGDWSVNREWRRRVPDVFRKLNTVHLMGRGYWVWIIPLASGSTSFGIVADPEFHPINKINRFEGALEWLRSHEPQCAGAVVGSQDKLQDFHVLKHFAHGCKRVFSSDRWCITGDAGLFLDPLYSPGSDFIALSNGFITDLISRDLKGEQIDHRSETYDRLLMTLFEIFLPIYKDQYPLMGNGEVMAAKVIWDVALYWGVTALLYLHDKYCDLDFMSSVQGHLSHVVRMNLRVQAFFRQWGNLNSRNWRDAFINLREIGFLADLQNGLVAGLNDDELRNKLSANLRLFEALASEMSRKREARLPVFTESEYLLGLSDGVDSALASIVTGNSKSFV